MQIVRQSYVVCKLFIIIQIQLAKLGRTDIALVANIVSSLRKHKYTSII